VEKTLVCMCFHGQHGQHGQQHLSIFLFSQVRGSIVSRDLVKICWPFCWPCGQHVRFLRGTTQMPKNVFILVWRRRQRKTRAH
jgi:hypothetical protein